MGLSYSRLDQINPLCCIQIALGIIVLMGASLSMASILSYLPPIAGYVGGGTSISSLIILAIGNCCEGKRISTILPPQKDDTVPVARQSAHVISSTLVNSTKKHAGIPFQSAYVTPSKLVIPDELYVLLLQYLDGKNLAAVSQVCRQWHHVASDNGLWERLCLNERICPPAGTLALPTSYQCLYSASQMWRRQLADLPTERQIPFPTQVGKDYFNSIWKIEDYFFVYSQTYEKDRFEIWDASLTRLICNTTLPNIFPLTNFRFKKVGDVAYFFGWSHHILGPHQLLAYPCDIYVLRLDLKTFQPLDCMHFPQKHRAHRDFKPQFEIRQNEAFIGQEDGTIVIWDLSYRKFDSHGCIFFDDQPLWTSKHEEDWQASFKKTNKMRNAAPHNSFYSSLCYLEEFELEMEEGAYHRCHAKRDRDHSHMLHNRKSLQGHTQAITSLRIVDDYLFSSSRDGTIKQWDLKTHQCVRTIDAGSKEEICMLNVAGHYLFGLAGENYSSKIIAQWDLTTGKRLSYKELKKNYETFHVVGNLVILALEKDFNKTIDMYDLFSQTCLQSLTLSVLKNSKINEYSMQIVNNSLYVTGKESLHIWDFSSKGLSYPP